jgi:hypothetical protein
LEPVTGSTPVNGNAFPALSVPGLEVCDFRAADTWNDSKYFDVTHTLCK